MPTSSGACYFGHSQVTRLQPPRDRATYLHAATMAGRWGIRFSVFALSLLAQLVSAEHSFENTAIVRTVDLGGSLVHVTTTYAVKALEDDSSIYTIALGEDEEKKTSWIQAKIKGQTVPLHLEKFGLNPNMCVALLWMCRMSARMLMNLDICSGAFLYAVEFPKALKANGTTHLVIETVQTHATYPWPKTAAQNEGQSLKYEADLFILSPYPTLVQRTKIKYVICIASLRTAGSFEV